MTKEEVIPGTRVENTKDDKFVGVQGTIISESNFWSNSAQVEYDYCPHGSPGSIYITSLSSLKVVKADFNKRNQAFLKKRTEGRG